jgi:mannose/cellobiose epimerase-like protein (N-acyl-D-glucosamine 2-epimerase family)
MRLNTKSKYLSLVSLFLILALLLGSCGRAQPDLTGLASGERWQQHLTQEIMPFWMLPDALGDPPGNFPSTRCNDGSRVDRQDPCPEVGGNGWLMQDQTYTVALSRQIYGYGVAFHMTGDPKYLDHMRFGVDYYRQHAFDQQNGGAYSWRDNSKGAWGPTPAERNPQEQAYALLGLAFYYYLTRDPVVLEEILASQEFIFKQYYNPQRNILEMTPLSALAALQPSQRLVAQLDQLNAYLVLLAPLLPEDRQKVFKASASQVAHILIEEFYHAGDNLFAIEIANDIDNAEFAQLPHIEADFGHTAKAMWLIRQVGKLTGETELVEFAEQHAQPLLDTAYIEASGSWALGSKDGVVNPDKEWWVYCELDQFAATLALSDPAYARYLLTTDDYWFSYFVDPEYGEVWSGLSAATNYPTPDHLPKQWPWKNAYHSTEHALIGYISSQQLLGQPVVLYFALPSNMEQKSIRPYIYDGKIVSIDNNKVNGWQISKVTFQDVK